MSEEDIERTARVELQGVVAADQHFDRYSPDATISRVAGRVVSMLLWLKPGLRKQVLDEAQGQLDSYRQAAE